MVTLAQQALLAFLRARSVVSTDGNIFPQPPHPLREFDIKPPRVDAPNLRLPHLESRKRESWIFGDPWRFSVHLH